MNCTSTEFIHIKTAMSQVEDFNIADIYNFELKLQGALKELDWKSKSLEECKKELLQACQELLNKEIALEETQRIANDLKMQLATAQQVIEVIEKEKAKCVNEKIQLQISCEAVMRERESLLGQAHSAKVENVTLTLSVQKLTGMLEASEASRKKLESSLTEAKGRFSRMSNSFQSNVTKLEKEQQLLRESIEATTQLNKRLQTVGLGTQAIFEKKNEEIENLREQLSSRPSDISRALQFNLDDYPGARKRSKIDTKAVLEQICLEIEKDIEQDKKLESILNEF